MNKFHNEKALQQKSLFSGLMGLLLIVFVAVACNIDLGENGGGQNDPVAKKDNKTTEKKRPKGEKKKVVEDDGPKPTKNLNSKGKFVPEYSAIKNQTYVAFNENMKDQKILEDITARLNNVLALPENVTVTFADCGVPNAFYSPRDKSITVCYEFMDLFYNIFLKMGKDEKEANQMMYGATTFFFLHELGHALIDVYELPATGREEDSADQLSTYILMDEMGKEGRTAAVDGALIFEALSKGETAEAQTFADEHSLSSQRYYNLLCWMYGKDQSQYSFVATEGLLPESRMVRCADEYSKLSRAWMQLVAPYRKR